MTTAAIRTKLHELIDKIDDKKMKAIYTILDSGEGTSYPQDHWQDENFVAEMDRRYDDYKSGKVKPISFEEVQKRARAVVAESRAKKNDK